MGFLLETKENAKKIPKSVWIVALIVPMGLTALAAYLAVKSHYSNKEKKEKDDRSEDC
jgi:hypothetical protein